MGYSILYPGKPIRTRKCKTWAPELRLKLQDCALNVDIYICLVYNMYILYHIIYIYQRCISIKSRISSCRTWFQSKDWIFQLHHFFLLHLGIFFVLIRISLSYCVNYISILLEGNRHCSLTEPISFTIANYKNILRWHMI